jgi:hypothetical protein
MANFMIEQNRQHSRIIAPSGVEYDVTMQAFIEQLRKPLENVLHSKWEKLAAKRLKREYFSFFMDLSIEDPPVFDFFGAIRMQFVRALKKVPVDCVIPSPVLIKNLNAIARETNEFIDRTFGEILADGLVYDWVRDYQETVAARKRDPIDPPPGGEILQEIHEQIRTGTIPLR